MARRKKILITGGAGFVGRHLIQFLQKNDEEIVVFDKLAKDSTWIYPKKLTYIQGNVLSKEAVQSVFEKFGPFTTVYHLAAAMPNKEVSDSVMWETNVTGTRLLIELAVKHKVVSFVFISSNVTYGIPATLPVTEETPLRPLEMYGRSKAQAEKELERYKADIAIQMFRCPVIAGVGRLGLQALLYEFISENRKVYVLGEGTNKYQFIDVMDVCDALEKASRMKGCDVYVIGADEVMTLRELYQHVITFAKSSSKIVQLPKSPSLLVLAILDKLNASPLGIYQYTMMWRSLYADTSKIKKKLAWKPKKTNLDTFLDNYKWYVENKGNFAEIGSGDFSPNRSVPKLGALKLLKFFS